ncbi:hypothetical protein Q3G72_008103 [Acer saccharum]|nr:hypothetical protein Q3G72_008103 [Acer saccharum]
MKERKKKIEQNKIMVDGNSGRAVCDGRFATIAMLSQWLCGVRRTTWCSARSVTGTGTCTTTVCVHLARSRPNRRFLWLSVDAGAVVVLGFQSQRQ